MILNEYIDPEFKKLLNNTDKIEVDNRKIDETVFASLWNRADPWFEKPNSRRSTSKESWSGVTRIQLKERNFFLKKQQDYFAYSHGGDSRDCCTFILTYFCTFLLIFYT